MALKLWSGDKSKFIKLKHLTCEIAYIVKIVEIREFVKKNCWSFQPKTSSVIATNNEVLHKLE